MSTNNTDIIENKSVQMVDSNSQLTWIIDHKHSNVTFKIKHLMIANLSGSFKTFDATVTTIGKDFSTAEIDLWIDVESIDTDNKERDEHLKSSEFFDSKMIKKINFKSTSIGKSDSENNHVLNGDLTIKNIIKKVNLNLEFGGIIIDPWGEERAGFTVTGKIKRSDWGIKWNTIIEAGGLMISDEISITCDIELTLKK